MALMGWIVDILKVCYMKIDLQGLTSKHPLHIMLGTI